MSIDASELGLPGMLHTASEKVPPGRYRRVEGWGREVVLPEGGVLPPSFDGRVALYIKMALGAELAVTK